MKKTFALIIAVLMLLSLGMTAFAEETENKTGDGKITIDNAVKDATYTVYRLLDLESYDATSNAYAYKANSAWETWLRTQTTYVSFDDQGYVTWVEGANAETFAKAAIAYAKANNITHNDQKKAESTTVVFDKLVLGYYLVDTSLGTLCSLDTTTPEVTIKEKNGEPSIDKKVEEDSKTGDDAWGKTNDADIGQVVNFKVTVTAKKGAENYVVHDQMSEGLTLDRSSIKVTVGETELTEGTDYTLSPALGQVVHSHLDGRDLVIDGVCTFDITFSQAYLDTITADTAIVITYSATVNEKAVVGLNGNPNKTWLDYGDENYIDSTPKSTTVTYTWDLDVLKYANGDESKVLKDAQFVLLNSDKTKVAVVVDGKLTSWADVPTEGTEWPENTVLTTGEDGKIAIDGLDSDTYYLRETKAPDGYNKLANDAEVVITGATKGDGDTSTYTTVVTKVENRSGTELPSTGAKGTAIFVTAGAGLALIAIVFMITRKKMSVYED